MRLLAMRPARLPIVAASACGSIGLAVGIWKPAIVARVRSSERANAVSAIAGVPFSVSRICAYVFAANRISAIERRAEQRLRARLADCTNASYGARDNVYNSNASP
jgi:hypothetical protein